MSADVAELLYSLVEPKLIDKRRGCQDYQTGHCKTAGQSQTRGRLIAPTHWIAKLQKDLAGAISSSIDWITIIVNFKVVSL